MKSRCRPMKRFRAESTAWGPLLTLQPKLSTTDWNSWQRVNSLRVSFLVWRLFFINYSLFGKIYVYLTYLVYKCRRGNPYKRTDADVVLKIVKTRINTRNNSHKDRLQTAILIQESLSHPNIVKLLHNFQKFTQLQNYSETCLVLELCERKCLTSLLELHGQVTFIGNFLGRYHKSHACFLQGV